MAANTGKSSTRSILLEIAIAVLIVILLTAILYPKKLWENQAIETQICRDRMENLFLASEFQRRASGGISTDIAATLAFAERESLTVQAAGFKMDRLTREDSGIDSFLVDYFDPYEHFSHYEKAVRIDYPEGPNKVVLTLVPKKPYPSIPISRCTFTSDVPISAEIDDRGDQGTFTLIGAQGRISIVQDFDPPVRMLAADYIYFIDAKDIHRCPACLAEYKADMNVKISVTADIFTKLENAPPEKPLGNSAILASNVVFRLLKEADAAAKRTMTENLVMETVEDSLLQIRDRAFLDSLASVLRQTGKDQLATAIYDSTLDNYSLSEDQRKEWDKLREASYDRMNTLKTDSSFSAERDEIVNKRKAILIDEKFAEALAKLKADKTVSINESGIVSTVSDSTGYYSQPDVIAARLIHEHSDSVTMAHLQRSDVRSLLQLFSYTEEYRTAKIDSIGLTIFCPIEGKFTKPNPSILDRLFSIGGAANHGNIRNGDLSWSEKR